ncbi:hypothetical protein B0H14DRAFT_2859697 [Mycena olivaceomarginata]|nr:hypothetical protein B0H14DRAFT_2859697 [Mycena olivaceomarginata]
MSTQAPRKLLVLDLNGTLLLRSKRTRSGPSPPNPGITRSRLVHPRPYLGTFKEYIFHPSTKKWLDAMVWSSAQPHSVADMLNHCFGQQQREFLAIWARDTLGLPPSLYHRKTQTTKDLAKPWATFPEHSHRTTLLLDDSARKAHLHPHNHVCVREYLAETRRHDLEVSQSSSSTPAPGGKPRKASKPKSKNAHAAELASVDASVDAPPAWFLSSPKYDETLLAVVGILEAVKSETDVAEWIRGGGLLAAGVADTVVEQAEDSGLGALANQMAALNLAQEVWFNSEATVNHWVGRGVLALEALQIPLVAGVRG